MNLIVSPLFVLVLCLLPFGDLSAQTEKSKGKGIAEQTEKSKGKEIAEQTEKSKGEEIAEQTEKKTAIASLIVGVWNSDAKRSKALLKEGSDDLVAVLEQALAGKGLEIEFIKDGSMFAFIQGRELVGSWKIKKVKKGMDEGQASALLHTELIINHVKRKKGFELTIIGKNEIRMRSTNPEDQPAPSVVFVR